MVILLSITLQNIIYYNDILKKNSFLKKFNPLTFDMSKIEFHNLLLLFLYDYFSIITHVMS